MALTSETPAYSTMSTTANNATGQIIWDTITDLRAAGQVISRQRLMELTGFVYTKVDDHVSRWIDDGQLRRVIDGVYEVVDAMPESRAVSVTCLPDGMTLIEAGDQELRLWPREVRALGQCLAGSAMQFAQLQTQHDVGALLVEATVRNRALAGRVGELEREQRKMKQYAFTWTPDRVQLLGTASDKDLATMFGIDTAIVTQERRRRNIVTYRAGAAEHAPAALGVGGLES